MQQFTESNLPVYLDASDLYTGYSWDYCRRNRPYDNNSYLEQLRFKFRTISTYVPFIFFCNPDFKSSSFSYYKYHRFSKNTSLLSIKNLFEYSNSIFEIRYLDKRFLVGKGIIIEITPQNSFSIVAIIAVKNEEELSPFRPGFMPIQGVLRIAQNSKLFLKKDLLYEKGYGKLSSLISDFSKTFLNEIVLLDDISEMFFTTPELPKFKTVNEMKDYFNIIVTDTFNV